MFRKQNHSLFITAITTIDIIFKAICTFLYIIRPVCRVELSNIIFHFSVVIFEAKISFKIWIYEAQILFLLNVIAR